MNFCRRVGKVFSCPPSCYNRGGQQKDVTHPTKYLKIYASVLTFISSQKIGCQTLVWNDKINLGILAKLIQST